MARALRLAERGRYSTQPNPRVGCVIVKDGQIVGEGFHHQAGQPHAEINALNQAGEAARGAQVYVTLEPCSHFGRTPPCANALVKAQPARVVIAMQDPNPLVAGKGVDYLRTAGIETRVGVCENDAQQLNRGFLMRMQNGRPFVRLKLASSLDGRIAMRSGESVWITSAAARTDVHRLRLESCAIITGINTVEVDDPKFTVRLNDADLSADYVRNARTPLRVVLDSKQRLCADRAILKQSGETWQVTAQALADVSAKGIHRTLSFPSSSGRVNLQALLGYLGEQQMNNVLVEAGGQVAAGFIAAGLVDELIVYQSPDIMGSSARAMIDLPEILKMSEKIKFEYRDLRKIGRDIKLVLSPTARV